jgi:uncharacterized membrane protein YkvA (DUF1232 family)
MLNKIKGRLKQTSKQIARNLSILFIAYKRKDTPKVTKVIVAIAVIYALSPLDLIPDFIPILGYLDDLIILNLLIYIAILIIPKKIYEEYKEEAKNQIIDKKNKIWYFGIPVAVIWIIIGMIVVKAVCPKIW